MTTALLERLTAAPKRGSALPRLRRRARADRRPAGGCVSARRRRAPSYERLAARYGLVAVVSGRAGDDVRERVAVDGVVYVGSHGLELDPQADRWRQQIADFASAAPWPAVRDRAEGPHGLLPLPQSRRRARGGARAGGDRGGGARRRARGAVRTQAARSAAAGRLEQGDGGAAPARRRGPRRGCSSRATTRPTSTRSARSRSSSTRCASRCSPTSRRRCSPSMPSSCSAAPGSSSSCCGSSRRTPSSRSPRCRRRRSRSSSWPISEVSNRIAMIAFAPFASASCCIRSITSCRLSTSAFVMPFSSPPKIDFRPAPNCEPMLRERTVRPITSPKTSSTVVAGNVVHRRDDHLRSTSHARRTSSSVVRALPIASRRT